MSIKRLGITLVVVLTVTHVLGRLIDVRFGNSTISMVAILLGLVAYVIFYEWRSERQSWREEDDEFRGHQSEVSDKSLKVDKD